MDFAAAIAAATDAALTHLGGVVVSYVPAPLNGEPAVEVMGIFDSGFVATPLLGDATVVLSGPRVFLRLADLPCDPEEDDWRVARITIGGTKYVMQEPRKDGQGGVLLTLREVDDA